MTSMRQVWHALPRPNPIKCACCMVLVCFGHFSSNFVFPKLVQCVKCANRADLLKKCTCGLEHS